MNWDPVTEQSESELCSQCVCVRVRKSTVGPKGTRTSLGFGFPTREPTNDVLNGGGVMST